MQGSARTEHRRTYFGLMDMQIFLAKVTYEELNLRTVELAWIEYYVPESNSFVPLYHSDILG
jgi:hypothetical protein